MTADPKETTVLFEELLDESVGLHGHLCAGQVIGVRMSMLALRLLGISDPKGKERKHLYVIVEIDRCATDAIQSVTGCSLGKRSLRWVDFGIMAATFYNLKTRKAVRLLAKEESRKAADNYPGDEEDKYRRQMLAYKVMPDDELFKIQWVDMEISPVHMPGSKLGRVICDRCGEWFQECKGIRSAKNTICKACGGERYYKVL